MDTSNPVIVALDVPTLDQAIDLSDQLGDAVGAVKIGLELFSAHGPGAVHALSGDHGVFLDLKLHDIPTTVGRAMASLRNLDVDLVTIHALGGRAMLEAANEEKGSTATLAVTILTSLDDEMLAEMGLPAAAVSVPRLAQLAADAGCDGVICAPTDIEAVRDVSPDDFLIVTPGVRLEGAATHDQARTRTPLEALDAGADHLVIGRPITRATDPRSAAEEILASLRGEA